jgi:hypothetical protein
MKKIKVFSAQFLIIFLSIAALAILLNLPFRAKIFGDWTFHAEAKQITEWVWGKTPLASVELTKAPGPSLFYAVPYIFAGPGKDDAYYWKWAVVWNTIWSILAIWLIGRAASILYGSSKFSMIVAVLAFLVPIHIYYGIGIIAETMAFCGCAFLVYGIVLFFREQEKSAMSSSVFIITGILFLIAARPNSALLLPCFLLIAGYLWKKSRYKIKPALIRFIKIPFLISSLLLVMMSLGIRNLPGNQQQPLQESYLIYVMHHGRFQFRTEPWDWRFWENSIRPDSRDYQDWEASKVSLKAEMDGRNETIFQVYSRWLIKDFLAHPLNFFKQAFIRLLFGHYLQINSADVSRFAIGPIPGNIVFFSVHFIVNLLNFILVIGAIIGFFRLFHKNPELLFILAPWLALSIFHSFSYMEHRYMFPTRPIILFLVAPVIFDWVQYVKVKIQSLAI